MHIAKAIIAQDPAVADNENVVGFYVAVNRLCMEFA